MNLKQNQIITYRNGETGRVICIDRDGRWSIITLHKSFFVKHHLESGKSADGDGTSPFDIMSEKKQLTGWVNVYPEKSYDGMYSSKEMADQHAAPTRVACVDLSKHNIKYEQGEGL